MNHNPTRQIIIPIILFTSTGSWYPIKPTKIKATAKKALETVESVLTFQPALYAKINPSSKPVITIPKTIVAQFICENSLKIFPPFEVTKNATAENKVATA